MTPCFGFSHLLIPPISCQTSSSSIAPILLHPPRAPSPLAQLHPSMIQPRVSILLIIPHVHAYTLLICYLILPSFVLVSQHISLTLAQTLPSVKNLHLPPHLPHHPFPNVPFSIHSSRDLSPNSPSANAFTSPAYLRLSSTSPLPLDIQIPPQPKSVHVSCFHTTYILLPSRPPLIIVLISFEIHPQRSRFRQELERRLKSKSPSSPSATPSDHWDQVLLGGSSVATLPTGTREKSTLFQSTRRCPPALLPSHSSTGLIRRASCGASSQFHSEPPSRAAAEPALLAHILSPTRLKAPPTSAPVFSTTSAPGMAPGGLRALRFAQPNPIFARVGLGSSLPPTVGETGLEDLLRSFTAVERLEGENRFACEACGADEEASLSSQPMTEKTDEAESTTKKCSKEPAVVLRRAWRRYMITTLPPVVVVHLKRFERANSDGPQPFISFPLKLDFGPYLCPTASRRDKATDEQGRIYGLYAVVVHRGLSVGGHYFAYVLSDRNGPPGGGVKGGVDGIERSWLYCSDV